MEEHLEGVASSPRAMGAAEGQMLRADLVREMVARRERGESTRQIARELAADRTTVRRWLRLGGWQPRQGGERPRAIDPYIEFIEQRGPEVDWNGVVLHRELVALGFSGSYQQVQRLLRPRRARRRWQEAATVRFETVPGEQAQVDYGQLQVWIGEHPETVHLFVLTLGYSRRLFTRGYRNERLATLLDGHEQLERLREHCHQLRLYQVENELTARLEQAAKKEISYAEFLDELLALEVGSKAQKHHQMRLAMARFPFQKTLESFDFKFQPSMIPSRSGN